MNSRLEEFVEQFNAHQEENICHKDNHNDSYYHDRYSDRYDDRYFDSHYDDTSRYDDSY